MISIQETEDNNSNTASSTGRGMHLVIDGFAADESKLSDLSLVRNLLDGLPDRIGMKKLTAPQVVYYDGGGKPEEQGISGFVLIAESHISIHTYPMKMFLMFDIYSCKNFDIEAAAGLVKEKFSVKHYRKRIFRRGEELGQKSALKKL